MPLCRIESVGPAFLLMTTHREEQACAFADAVTSGYRDQDERPTVCPKCKSLRWDKPKLYERKVKKRKG